MYYNSDMTKKTQVAIIGSGPAGLTAAIYCARADLEPILFAGISFGGQLMTTTDVENYPGFPEGIEGPELMQRMVEQAKRFGTQIVYENVTKVDFSNEPLKLYAADEEYTADSVIVAVGSTPRKLGLESEETYWGKGVSTCATCDGAFYKGKVVAVVGGGDSAMEEATFLTRFAKKVYILHRRDEFRASQIMQERTFNNEKIEVLWNTEVRDIYGNNGVEGIKIVDTITADESDLAIDGLFLAIGHVPQTAFLKGEIKLDDHGYIKVYDDVKTSKEGVFVAGDVADPYYQQAITAAGEGCKAALKTEAYLVDRKTTLAP